MKVRGVDFGPVLGASGVSGFFGEGYSYHQWLEKIPGFNFKGMTFVAKTTTLDKRAGNMPLQEDGITPVEFKPKCIKVSFSKGAALNAVGLSGPGAKALFDADRWQNRKNPFMLSFMSVASETEERIAEAEQFCELLAGEKENFSAEFGLQINFSCPNVGLKIDELLNEAVNVLDIAGKLNIPIMLKFNTALPVLVAKDISQHKHCDALCISNTLPWNDASEEERLRYFGKTESPLAHLNGGGISGKPLLDRVIDWVQRARYQGIEIPINAGGGILHPRDVVTLRGVGADSIFIGSVVFLRPWRLQRIIQTAQEIF